MNGLSRGAAGSLITVLCNSLITLISISSVQWGGCVGELAQPRVGAAALGKVQRAQSFEILAARLHVSDSYVRAHTEDRARARSKEGRVEARGASLWVSPEENELAAVLCSFPSLLLLWHPAVNSSIPSHRRMIRVQPPDDMTLSCPQSLLFRLSKRQNPPNQADF